ncbi:MAG: hypothetical protein RBU25_06880, partial [Lentisphaeria bacterium]|nr:hypothetical protein [Lentisphaeria bacterium]
MKREYQRLPRGLAANLVAAERRDIRVAAFQAVLGLLFALGAVFLPFLALERLWSFPRPLRAAALMLALAGAGWYACGWLARRWRCRRDPFATIRRIERHYPELGDSLRGVIELAAGEAPGAGISESLRLAAVRQVDERCRALDFGAAISTARVRTYGRRVVAVAVVLAVCAWFEPDLLGNALARFVRPWAAIPRYSFARLEALPAVLPVARGEAFSVPVRLAGNSRWNPGRLSFRLGRGERKTSPVEQGQAVLDLPGITEPASLHMRLGDAAAAIRLEPVPRPALLELVGDATLPDYLARPVETLEFVRSRPRLVEGSRVVLRGTVLNPLARAWLGDGEMEFAVEGHSFASSPLALEKLGESRLNWQDRHGLQPAEPYRLELEVVPDAPPAVQFEGVLRIFAVLEGEVLDLPLLALDDYGIRGVEVAWEVTPVDRPDAPPSASERRSVGTGAPDRASWSGTFVFSPQRLGIPAGNKATIRALAADYKPGRPFSESHPVEVIVMTPEDHARLEENLFAALRNRMEEAALREAQQLLDNEDLARLSDEELRQSDAERRLEKQAELERKSVEDWQRLADEGAKLLAEATRNESFSAE